jgi:hypothetical protein
VEIPNRELVGGKGPKMRTMKEGRCVHTFSTPSIEDSGHKLLLRVSRETSKSKPGILRRTWQYSRAVSLVIY